MKGKVKILVVMLAIAVLVAALAVGLVACNPKETPQSASDDSTSEYAEYSGTYYEYFNGALYSDSYIKLNGDGSWLDADNAGGKFKIEKGLTVKIYLYLNGTTDVPFADGVISSGIMILDMLGSDVTYKKGTPTTTKPTEQKPDDGGDHGDPEVIKFSIDFLLNGGEEEYASREYAVGALLSDLPQPTRKGYIFLNWLGNDRRVYDRTSVMPAYDLVLTAQWQKEVSYYKDDYVTFKPATQGLKHSSEYYDAYRNMGINAYVYVELTSDDIGGRSHVGLTNNFDLSQKVNMEYSSTAGYILNWYDGDFNTPNGAQLFTLYYGSNIQLLTVTRGSQVVRRYLVDIYILHDYQVKTYKSVYDRGGAPYATYWVRENEKVPADIAAYDRIDGFVPDRFVYYNDRTDKFENFDFDTVVQEDWSLYETYKDVTIGAGLGGGNMQGTIKLIPYKEYQQLPTPTLEGYDFIGWKMPNGKYFADVTGFSATNYLSADDDDDPIFTSLTAEWREKRYFEKWDGKKVTFVPTVPIVTYASASQNEVLDVVYVPDGYDCTLPVKTPSEGWFIKWCEWQKSGAIKGVDFDFDARVTSPKALYAYCDSESTYYISIPLNASRSFSNSSASQPYRVMMPVKGDYILRVSGNVTISVDRYGNSSGGTYTVSGSKDITLVSSLADGQYATFYVTKSSGSFSIGLYGATASTKGKLVSNGIFDKVGDSVTAESSSDWCCWLLDGEKVSDGTSRELPITADMIGKTYEKRYGHTFGDWKIDGEYKCEDTVTRHKDCSVCGYSEVDDNYYIDHVLSDWIEDSPASCTAKAHHHKECENCDHREDEDYGNLLPHEMGEWKIDVEYTCGDTVTRHKDCANCEYSEVDDHYYIDHVMGEWIEDSPASCTAKAHHHKECENCDHREDEDYGQILPHEMSDWIEDSPASCTAKAHHHKECENCDHREEEDYGNLLPHEMSDWIEDSPASCTAKAHHHKECENCDHREDEDYGNLLPHEMSDWIEDSPASCTAKAHHHKECENCDHREEEDYGQISPHDFDPVTKKCKMCQSNDFSTGETLHFGEYPQTRETDNGITATLAQMSGARPVKGNSGKWTDYGYYISGEVDEYMWYIDLDYNGARYRGVYFTSYRPYETTYGSSTGNTYQDDNGYEINTLYWFKWEPIEWRVLERTDGELFLMSNVILDSQQYYRTTSGTRNIDGKTVYPNNYKESDIRAWLNGTFYNWAFDEFEQAIINETLVDNSASTTDSSSNRYACENTNDKVFLLSYKEATNTSYGFSSNSTRQLKPTDYAKSQGTWVLTDSNYRGNGWWWLRSPYCDHAYFALYVSSDGDAGHFDYVKYARYGVFPALRITL